VFQLFSLVSIFFCYFYCKCSVLLWKSYQWVRVKKILLLGSGRVSHLWFGYRFGKFPLKMPNFSIFCPSGKKNVISLGRKVPGSGLGWPLFYCGSKVCSGRVGSGPNSFTLPSYISLPHFSKSDNSFPANKRATL